MNVRLVLIKRTLIGIAVAIVATCLGLFGYQIYRANLSLAILAKVDRLVLYTPEDCSELEWAVHVYWTHNLHCAAIPQVYASLSSLHELNRFLDDAVERGPDRSTIEALWVRYAALSAGGQKYSARYDPVRREIANAVARDGESYADAGSYRGLREFVRDKEDRLGRNPPVR
jgi:hypothetical protein